MISYKQRCSRCKKNMVLITTRKQFPVCYDCEKNELHGEIKNKKMKKFFDLPEEFYKEEPFLRSIKINYMRYGQLSDKQIEWFKKVVERMKNPQKNL